MDEVTDVQVRSEKREGGAVRVKGGATVGLELNYGSDGDRSKGQGGSDGGSFRFPFEALLSGDGVEILSCGPVDTPSFYE